jgi:hypothetical protein
MSISSPWALRRNADGFSIARGLRRGAIAGAAGTTALNAVTFVDMVMRARAASRTPEATVEQLSERTHVPIPGEDGERNNRVSGLGSLSGVAAGLVAGLLVGVVSEIAPVRRVLPLAMTATGLALLTGNGPMTALGVTDLREWSISDWAADLVPHLAFGLVAGSVLASDTRR